MVRYRLCVIGLTNFIGSSTFHLLYMTLAINKMDGYGLSNTAYHECPPKKTKVMRYKLQKDCLLDSSNKTERFSYKGE